VRELNFGSKIVHPAFKPMDLGALATQAAERAVDLERARRSHPTTAPSAPTSASTPAATTPFSDVRSNPAFMPAAGVRTTERVQRDQVQRQDAGRKHWGSAATAFAETGTSVFFEASYPS
jgi:hypothetical protein